MSLYRFVYYSAVVCGWAAFLAWMILERPVRYIGSLGGSGGLSSIFWDIVAATITAAIVGAALGTGLNLVSGMSNAQWRQQLGRIIPGLIGGGIGGAVGGLLGAGFFAALESIEGASWLAWPLGWMTMGLGIGGAQGICERSASKIRNGLIGGALGGLMGGTLFGMIAGPESGMSSRATAFVVVGLSIGALIGLTHVVLKEAWLTVVDGFRPGRQFILSATSTSLGRGDHLPLPLLGYSGKDLESEHSEVVRQPDGNYLIRDKGSRIGTRLNGQLIADEAQLADGDIIKLGTNLIRFNHRRGGISWGRAAAAGQVTGGGTGSIAPPPPPGALVRPPGLPKPGGGPGLPKPPAASPGVPGKPPSLPGPGVPETPGGKGPAPLPPPPLPGAGKPLKPPPLSPGQPGVGSRPLPPDGKQQPNGSPRIPPPPPPPLR